MPDVASSSSALKQAVKEALLETLHENRDLLRDVLVEVLEDYALSEAIRDGERSPAVGRDDVMAVLGTQPQAR